MARNAGGGKPREKVERSKAADAVEAARVGATSGGSVFAPMPRQQLPQGLVNLAGFSKTLRRIAEREERQDEEQDAIKGRAAIEALGGNLIDKGLPEGETQAFRMAAQGAATEQIAQLWEERVAARLAEFDRDMQELKEAPGDINQQMRSIMSEEQEKILEEAGHVARKTKYQEALWGQKLDQRTTMLMRRWHDKLIEGQTKTGRKLIRLENHQAILDVFQGSFSTLAGGGATLAKPNGSQIAALQEMLRTREGAQGHTRGPEDFAMALVSVVDDLASRRTSDGERMYDDDTVLQYVSELGNRLTAQFPVGRPDTPEGTPPRVPLASHPITGPLLDELEDGLERRRGSQGTGVYERRANRMIYDDSHQKAIEKITTTMGNDLSANQDPRIHVDAALKNLGITAQSPLFVPLRTRYMKEVLSRLDVLKGFGALARQKASVSARDMIARARTMDEVFDMAEIAKQQQVDPSVVRKAVEARRQELASWASHSETSGAYGAIDSAIDRIPIPAGPGGQARREAIRQAARDVVDNVARELMTDVENFPGGVDQALHNLQRNPAVAKVIQETKDAAVSYSEERSRILENMRTSANRGQISDFQVYWKAVEQGYVSSAEVKQFLGEANQLADAESWITSYSRARKTADLQTLAAWAAGAQFDDTGKFKWAERLTAEFREIAGLPGDPGQPITADMLRRGFLRFEAALRKEVRQEVLNDNDIIGLPNKRAAFDERMTTKLGAWFDEMSGGEFSEKEYGAAISGVQGLSPEEQTIIRQQAQQLKKSLSPDLRTPEAQFEAEEKVFKGEKFLVPQSMVFIDEVMKGEDPMDTADFAAFMPPEAELEAVEKQLSGRPYFGEMSDPRVGRSDITEWMRRPLGKLPSGQSARVALTDGFRKFGSARRDVEFYMDQILDPDAGLNWKDLSRSEITNLAYNTLKDPKVSPAKTKGIALLIAQTRGADFWTAIKRKGRVSLLGTQGVAPMPDADVDRKIAELRAEDEKDALTSGMRRVKAYRSNRGSDTMLLHGEYVYAGRHNTPYRERHLQRVAQLYNLELSRLSVSLDVKAVVGDRAMLVPLFKDKTDLEAAAKDPAARQAVAEYFGVSDSPDDRVQAQFWDNQRAFLKMHRFGELK
jgi:hypothetical protein